ncbi:ABC transporter ATP-binding protein [Rhodococcus globerulus]|uniref:ABC transporter ATP-binding protein n=1 Tax=Rhodococcus globerulus TaxID=33008 RepID=UPI001C595BCC|nr:ABC transporter ATP-binding protein [Rhodococcus globerulus]QXW01324.1 ABC transporter ATP-binding protein [Rhodococcus globerulus]
MKSAGIDSGVDFPGERVTREATIGSNFPGSQPKTQELAFSVKSVRHWFGGPREQPPALDDVSINVREGEFLALVGPSGCGKTTLLNMLAGLIRPDEGNIAVRGEQVVRPRASVGYISARDALLPWRPAWKNVAFGLETQRMTRAARKERAYEMLELVGLKGYEELKRGELSQGMRQRVAIARTLAVSPEIILLDEPFSALDQQTKLILEGVFIDIWEKSRKTIVMVTHDIEEAVAMADRVVMLTHRPGRIRVDMEIDLPRPRDVAEIRYDPRFREITHTIWGHLREELQSINVFEEG